MIILFVQGLLNFHVTFITIYGLSHGLVVALTSANNQKPPRHGWPIFFGVDFSPT